MEYLLLGQKVKNFRQSRKFSQLQLETEIQASPGSISRIENNIVNPTKETLLKIAEVLDLSFSEKIELFGLNYTEIDRYIPYKFQVQNISNNRTLKDLIKTQVFDYAFVKGKDYFIRECDSSLLIPSTEVLYLKNIHNWRKVYSEQEANTYHVPKRIDIKKYGRFLMTPCTEALEFKNEDYKYYRETRLIKSKVNFEFTLMIEQSSITIFISEPNVTAFTLRDQDTTDYARNMFNVIWDQSR